MGAYLVIMLGAYYAEIKLTRVNHMTQGQLVQ
jgi:hypothetical protein